MSLLLLVKLCGLFEISLKQSSHGNRGNILRVFWKLQEEDAQADKRRQNLTE